MKKPTNDQILAVVSIVLTNTDWDALDGDVLQRDVITKAKEFGRQNTSFLKAGAKMPFSGFIDMDRPSTRVPEGWKVRPQDQLPNRATGTMKWNPAATSLHLSEEQTTGKMYVAGPDLKTELGKLKDQLVVTDAVADSYLDYPEIPTPEAWLGKWVICWGRIYYRSSDGRLLVRSLDCGTDGSRNEYCHYVSDSFFSNNPALVIPAGKSVLGA